MVMGSGKTKIATYAGCIVAVVIAGAALYWRQLSSPLPHGFSELKEPLGPVIVKDQKSTIQPVESRGKYNLAVAEARRYYNTAPLTQTGIAVTRLAAAIRQSGLYPEDPQFAEKLLAQQQAGALSKSPNNVAPAESTFSANLLKTIPLDAESNNTKIQSPNGSDNYDDLMARGDLLLSADRCAEAREAFLSACRIVTGTDKKLFDAVEGIARSIRAETGYAGPANAMILALSLGQKPEVLKSIPEERWQKGEMQIAGQRVVLPQLSQSVRGSQPGAAEEILNDQLGQKSSGNPSTAGYDLADPLVVASLAPEPDSELVLWLRMWEKRLTLEMAPVTAPEELSQLKSILEKTKTPCLLLLHLGHACQLRGGSQGSAAAALLYEASANRVEKELSDAGHTPQAAAIVRAMKDHMNSYKDVLWPLIESGDRPATDALYGVYTAYVRFAPTEDRSLARPVIHATIGAAECLYVMGRTDEAAKLLDPLKSVRMERGEQAAFDWASAIILFELERFAEAIPHLEPLRVSATRAQGALAMLVTSYAKTGDRQHAREALDELQKRYPQAPLAMERFKAMLGETSAGKAPRP